MDHGPDQASMVVVNDDGRLLAEPETVSLASVSRMVGDRLVVALLPARELVSCLAEVPASSPSRLRQMLPFSLEDEFAADIEDLHFAPGERNADGLLAVSAISKERLRFWLSALKSAGIEPSQVLSEADAVADTPGTVTLYLEGRKILGRRPGAAPFQFEELTLDELWRLLESESEDTRDLSRVVLFVDSQAQHARQEEIERWRERLEDLDVRELPDGCLPRLAASLVAQPAPNLLQGEFGTRSDFAVILRPWRAAAGFVLALIAFSLVGKTAEVWKLSRDDAQLAAEANIICAQSYLSPQLDRCEAEMSRRLVNTSQGGGGNSGFLEIMSVVGANAGNALQIENINYRNGVLVIEVVVPSIPYLESFVQGVSGAGGYNALPGRTEAVDAGYEVRVEIVRI
jgi:general secretion pathway protein L